MEEGLAAGALAPASTTAAPATAPPAAPDAADAGGEPKVYAKFIFSNAAAGSIIGKAGAQIVVIQQQSGSRMQLSRSNDFFPGSPNSQDRVALISGSVNQVLTALHLILAKLTAEPAIHETMLHRDNESTVLRMLVPQQLAGGVIGKGGATIRSFQEDSKCQITVSPRDKVIPGVTERIIKLIGNTDQLMRAVALVVTKLAENPDFSRFASTTVNYGGSMQVGGVGSIGGIGMGAGAGAGAGVSSQASQLVMQGLIGGMSLLGLSSAAGSSTRTTEIAVPVPESRVGAIIGKQGEIITQMKSITGVKIQISDKNDFIPGTRDRKVTIAGPADSVQIAQAIIQQKINQAGMH